MRGQSRPHVFFLMSLAVMLEPGADDIFVFTNTWKNVRRHHPEMHEILQLQEALKVGGKAMVSDTLPRPCDLVNLPPM